MKTSDNPRETRELIVTRTLRVPVSEFTFKFARSGGPGGQNVNKVNSKVHLTWDVSRSSALSDDVRARFLAQNATRMNKDGLFQIVSQKYRDQGRNIDDCLEKLGELLRAATIVPRKRKPTRPSLGAKQRRLDAKKATSARKQSRRRIRHDD